MTSTEPPRELGTSFAPRQSRDRWTYMLHDPSDVKRIHSHKLANAQNSIDPAGVVTLALQLTDKSLTDIRQQFKMAMHGAISQLQNRCFFDFDESKQDDSVRLETSTKLRTGRLSIVPKVKLQEKQVTPAADHQSASPSPRLTVPLTSMSRIYNVHFLENFTQFFNVLKQESNTKRSRLQQRLDVLVEAQKHKSQSRQQQHQALLSRLDSSAPRQLTPLASAAAVSPEVRAEMSHPDDRINQKIHEATDALETVTECCEVLAYCSDLKFLDRMYHLIDCGSTGYVKWDDITNFFLDGAVLAKVYGERADALSEWQLEPAAIRGISHRPHKLRPMGETENLIIVDRSDAIFTYDPIEEKSKTIAASGSIVSTSITCAEFIAPLDCFIFATTAAELVIYDPNFSGAINYEKVQLPHPVTVMTWCARMQRLLCGDRHGRVAAYELARSRWKRLLPPVFDSVLTSHSRSADMLLKSTQGPSAIDKVLSANERRERQRSGFVQSRLLNPTASSKAAAAATAESQQVMKEKREARKSPPRSLSPEITKGGRSSSSRNQVQPDLQPVGPPTFLDDSLLKDASILTQGKGHVRTSEPLATSKVFAQSALQSSMNDRSFVEQPSVAKEEAVVAIAVHRLNGAIVVAYEDGLCQVITPPYSTHDHKSFVSLGKPLCCIGIVETQGAVIVGTSEPQPEVWSLAACEDKNVKPHYLTSRNSRHESPIVGIATFHNSDQCFSMDFLGLVKVWDLRTNAPLQHFQLEVRDSRIGWVGMQSSGAGDAIYCCDRQQIICFRRSDDVKASSNALLAKRAKNGAAADAAAASEDDPEQQYLIQQQKNALRQMDVEAADIGANITFGGYSPLTLRVVSSTAREVVYHETSTGKPVCEADILTATSHLTSVTQEPSSSDGAADNASDLNTISPTKLSGGSGDNKREISAAILDKQGARMFCGLTNGSVIVLNVASGGVVEVFPRAHRNCKVECLTFIDHLNCAVSCGTDGSGSYLYRPPPSEFEGKGGKTGDAPVAPPATSSKDKGDANALHLPAFPAFRLMTGCVIAYVGDPTYVLLATDGMGRISAFDCRRFDPTGANSVTPLFTMLITIGTNVGFESVSGQLQQQQLVGSRPDTGSSVGRTIFSRPTSSGPSIGSDFDKGDNLTGFIETAMDPSAVASSLLAVQRTAAAMRAMRKKKTGIASPKGSPRAGAELDTIVGSSPVERLRAMISQSSNAPPRPDSSAPHTARGPTELTRIVQSVIGLVVFKNQEHIIVGDPQYITLLRLDRAARHGVIIGQWAMDTTVSPTLLRNPELAQRLAVNQTTTDPLVTSLHLDTDRNVLLAVYDTRTVVAMDVGSFVPSLASATEVASRRAKADERIKVREALKLQTQQTAMAQKRKSLMSKYNNSTSSTNNESSSKDKELATAALSATAGPSDKLHPIGSVSLNLSFGHSEVKSSIFSFAEASEVQDTNGGEYDDLGDVLDAPDPQPKWLYQVKTNSPVASVDIFTVRSPVSDLLPVVASQRPVELISKLFSASKNPGSPSASIREPVPASSDAIGSKDTRHFALVGYVDGYVDLLDAGADLNLAWTSSKVWAQPIHTEYPHNHEDTFLVRTFVPFKQSELEHEGPFMGYGGAKLLQRKSSMLAGIRRHPEGIQPLGSSTSKQALLLQQNQKLTSVELSNQLTREALRMENFNRRQSFGGHTIDNGIVYAKSLTQALRRKSEALVRINSLSRHDGSFNSSEMRRDGFDFTADNKAIDAVVTIADASLSDKPPKSQSLNLSAQLTFSSPPQLHRNLSNVSFSDDLIAYNRPISAAQSQPPPSALRRHSLTPSVKSVVVVDPTFSSKSVGVPLPPVPMAILHLESSSSLDAITAGGQVSHSGLLPASTTSVSQASKPTSDAPDAESATAPAHASRKPPAVAANPFGPFVTSKPLVLGQQPAEEDEAEEDGEPKVAISPSRLRLLRSTANSTALIKRSETLPPLPAPAPNQRGRLSLLPPVRNTSSARKSVSKAATQYTRPVVIATGSLTTTESPLPTASSSRAMTPYVAGASEAPLDSIPLSSREWLTSQLAVLGRGRVKIKRTRKAMRKPSHGAPSPFSKRNSRSPNAPFDENNDNDNEGADEEIPAEGATTEKSDPDSTPTRSRHSSKVLSATAVSSKAHRTFGYDTRRSKRRREKVKSQVHLDDEAELRAVQAEVHAANVREERRRRRKSSVYNNTNAIEGESEDSNQEIDDSHVRRSIAARVQGSYDFFAERLRKEMHGELGGNSSRSSSSGGYWSYSSEYPSGDEGDIFVDSFDQASPIRPGPTNNNTNGGNSPPMDLTLQILKDKKAGLIPLFTTRGGIPVYLNEDCNSVCVPADNLHQLDNPSSMPNELTLAQQSPQVAGAVTRSRSKGRQQGAPANEELSFTVDTSLRARAEGPGGHREYAVIASFRNQDPRTTTKEEKVQRLLGTLRRHKYELEDFADKLNMGSRYVRRRRPVAEEVLNVSTALGRRVLVSEMHQHTGGTDAQQKDAEEADRMAKEISGNGARQPSPLMELGKKAWWARTPTNAVPGDSRSASRPGTGAVGNSTSLYKGNASQPVEDPSVEHILDTARTVGTVISALISARANSPLSNQRPPKPAPLLPYQLLAKNKTQPKIPLQTRPATREATSTALMLPKTSLRSGGVPSSASKQQDKVHVPSPIPRTPALGVQRNTKGRSTKQPANKAGNPPLLGPLEVKHIPSDLMDVGNYHRHFIGVVNNGDDGYGGNSLLGTVSSSAPRYHRSHTPSEYSSSGIHSWAVQDMFE